MNAHLALETERLIADGLSPADARAAALKAFGNVVAAEERFYDSNRWIWLEHFTRDLKYGARALWHSPSFLFTTVLTLTVALSLVTVAFAIFNAYVLRPFAVKDPGSLHRVAWRAPDSGGQQFRWEDYEALRRQRSASLPAVIAEYMRLVSSGGRALAVAFVSDNYFESLAPRMLLGRGLGPLVHGRGQPLGGRGLAGEDVGLPAAERPPGRRRGAAPDELCRQYPLQHRRSVVACVRVREERSLAVLHGPGVDQRQGHLQGGF